LRLHAPPAGPAARSSRRPARRRSIRGQLGLVARRGPATTGRLTRASGPSTSASAKPQLRRLYPRLLQHAMTTFGSTDIMRFLGRRIPLSGDIPKRFAGDVVSDVHERQEGVRIKHCLNNNSVKLYDKAFTIVGSVLRAEGTLNNVDDFRVYRPKEGDAEGELAWRPLRRGIADLHRRAEVSRKATERYLDALAS